jgi:hypothetical protein
MNKQQWPIQAGGVYRALGSVCYGIYRVFAIDGETVHAHYMWVGDTVPMSTRSMSMEIFRMCAEPQDQSPIPFLIAVLKGIEWGGADPLMPRCPSCDNSKGQGHQEGCLIAEAIAKGESSAKIEAAECGEATNHAN